MSVETICQRVFAEIPNVVGAAVVDLETGMLMSVQTRDQHSADMLDMLSASTKDFFESETALRVEKMFKERRDDHSPEHYFQEIIVNSTNLVHLFLRIRRESMSVLVVVCEADVNLGLAITRSRQIAAESTF